jgi:hypothetical protein
MRVQGASKIDEEIPGSLGTLQWYFNSNTEEVRQWEPYEAQLNSEIEKKY